MAVGMGGAKLVTRLSPVLSQAGYGMQDNPHKPHVYCEGGLVLSLAELS